MATSGYFLIVIAILITDMMTYPSANPSITRGITISKPIITAFWPMRFLKERPRRWSVTAGTKPKPGPGMLAVKLNGGRED
jgi:hypothetical protein